MKSNFSVAPVEYSQIENGTSISAPQPVVKAISDSAMRHRPSRHQRRIQSERYQRAGKHQVALVEADAGERAEVAAQDDGQDADQRDRDAGELRAASGGRRTGSATTAPRTAARPTGSAARSAPRYIAGPSRRSRCCRQIRSPTGTASSADARAAPASRCFRCGQANGSRIRKVPNQRTQDSVSGGTWPAT